MICTSILQGDQGYAGSREPGSGQSHRFRWSASLESCHPCWPTHRFVRNYVGRWKPCCQRGDEAPRSPLKLFDLRTSELWSRIASVYLNGSSRLLPSSGRSILPWTSCRDRHLKLIFRFRKSNSTSRTRRRGSLKARNVYANSSESFSNMRGAYTHSHVIGHRVSQVLGLSLE